MKAALAAVALALPPLPAAPATHSLTAGQASEIDSLLRTEMRRREIPGLAAGIVRGRDVAWVNAYGQANLESAVPTRPETVFRLASVSKPITATLLMSLVEQGRLDLDAPIQRYVPAFPEKPWPVTARQLLGHLGGIRHYRPGEFGNTRHYLSLTDSLSLFKDDPLAHQPGTRYLYSNYGYTLLGLAVETATGLPYARSVHERVFAPAGMETAGVCDVLEVTPWRAAGYARAKGGGLRNSALSDTSSKVPGAGLCASARDMARFASALLADRLLGPPTKDRMFTAQRTRAGRTLGYGLGWALATDAQGRREVLHTGGQQEVSTVLYMVPRAGLAVVILCNLEGLSDTLPEVARRMARVVRP